MLPDVEGQERGEAAGDGVGGAGLLGDEEGAVGGGGAGNDGAHGPGLLEIQLGIVIH